MIEIFKSYFKHAKEVKNFIPATLFLAALLLLFSVWVGFDDGYTKITFGGLMFILILFGLASPWIENQRNKSMERERMVYANKHNPEITPAMEASRESTKNQAREQAYLHVQELLEEYEASENIDLTNLKKNIKAVRGSFKQRGKLN